MTNCPVSPPPSIGSLGEVEVHLVVDVLPLWVEPLEDLSQHVDRLLAAQACALGLELLQQVFGRHGLPDQVASHGLLCQLHVAGERRVTMSFHEKHGPEKRGGSFIELKSAFPLDWMKISCCPMFDRARERAHEGVGKTLDARVYYMKAAQSQYRG